MADLQALRKDESGLIMKELEKLDNEELIEIIRGKRKLRSSAITGALKKGSKSKSTTKRKKKAKPSHAQLIQEQLKALPPEAAAALLAKLTGGAE